MKTRKSTKRALVLSVCSILLCFVMLIGTTFAWFTDTASTGVSTINSGKLQVEIQDLSGEEVETLSWAAKDGRTQDQILWEPGATYTLTPFKIVNTGNLALKYKLIVTGLNGDAELLDVIEFSYSIDGQTLDLSTEGHLAPREATGTITISAKMAETAGNDYMGKTLEGVKFTVYATQDTVEHDSFDNQYDRYASYAPSGETRTVTTYAEMKQALDDGVNIILDGHLQSDASKTGVNDRFVVKMPTVLDLNGPYYVHGELENSDNWAVLFIGADTTINASSGGGIACLDKINPSEGQYKGGPYVAHIAGEGIVVTVNGGTYHGGGTVFNVQKGTLVVNGGFFQVTPDVNTNDCRYTLNCIDANYKNGTANIIVKGGTFVNFDPSNNLAEGPNTNFVPEGYEVVAETQSNGDIWYTVVAE